MKLSLRINNYLKYITNPIVIAIKYIVYDITIMFEINAFYTNRSVVHIFIRKFDFSI